MGRATWLSPSNQDKRNSLRSKLQQGFVPGTVEEFLEHFDEAWNERCGGLVLTHLGTVAICG